MCKECAWESALERISEAEEVLAEIEAEAATEFVDSVGEKLDDMREWIAENTHVTAAQEEAIRNIAAGAKKWLR